MTTITLKPLLKNKLHKIHLEILLKFKPVNKLSILMIKVYKKVEIYKPIQLNKIHKVSNP
jgi:hypothetical protein